MLARAIPGTSSEAFRRRSVVAAVAAAVALTSVLVAGPHVRAATTLNVLSGIGDATVVGEAYLPGDVTVLVGDSVTFAIGSDDPHTITFGQGPADVPPFAWPVVGFTAPPAGAPPPYDLGTTMYDGTGFVNTGILFGKTSKATVTFSAAGAFPFLCAIHPGMAGTVNVVESGATTSQADADAAAASTSEFLLSQVDPLRADRLAATTQADNADGTRTWNVFVDAATDIGPMPGGGTGRLELTEFTPPAIAIGVGDTVHWTSSVTHTVTFIPDGVDPATVFPSEEAVFAPLGGDTYDGSAPANSGVFNIGPGTPSEYSLTFPKAGVYPFFCAIHAQLGQVGMLAVGVPLPQPSPSGSATPAG